MKITVDIEDFYMEEDSAGLESSLKEYITQNVVRQISKSIEDKVAIQVVTVVKEMIDTEMTLIIRNKVGEIVKEPKLIPERYGKEKYSLEEYIRKMFEDVTAKTSPAEHIASLALTFTKNLKERYDMQFAAQIVNKMAAQGLLKDDAIKNLLQTNG